jgi:hypothetical protein
MMISIVLQQLRVEAKLRADSHRMHHENEIGAHSRLFNLFEEGKRWLGKYEVWRSGVTSPCLKVAVFTGPTRPHDQPASIATAA